MKKIKYIIQREYTVRVRKRTFWILTFLLPLLYAGLIGFSVFMAENPSYNRQQVTVIDYSGLYRDFFKNNEDIVFYYTEPGTEQQLIELLKEQEDMHVLLIPQININDPKGFKLFSSKKSGNFVIDKLRYDLGGLIKDERIKALGLNKEVIRQLDARIDIEHSKVDKGGLARDNTEQSMVIATVTSLLSYMFVFIYGSLVMRGIHEEKQNRIVEIIVSSVRPFELMFGKIIGVALVGLTQFLLWVLFILVITLLGMKLPDLGVQQAQAGIAGFIGGMATLNIPLILFTFLIYFIGGYLLYSSLMGAIAAAVDNQSDMQQFVLPITIPLIISIVAMQAVIRAPHSPIAIWLSMIPFTSPVIMVARVAFEVPWHELLLSYTLLLLTFIFSVWLGGKIYRVGILFHGSKVSYRDLWKWLFYS